MTTLAICYYYNTDKEETYLYRLCHCSKEQADRTCEELNSTKTKDVTYFVKEVETW